MWSSGSRTAGTNFVVTSRPGPDDSDETLAPAAAAWVGMISPVLVPDPCSLLRPITRELRDRWLELSRDLDGQGGRSTDQSRCEARLALTLEVVGLLEPAVTR